MCETVWLAPLGFFKFGYLICSKGVFVVVRNPLTLTLIILDLFIAVID